MTAFYCDDVALVKAGGVNAGSKLSLLDFTFAFFNAHHFVHALLIFIDMIILLYLL